MIMSMLRTNSISDKMKINYIIKFYGNKKNNLLLFQQLRDFKGILPILRPKSEPGNRAENESLHLLFVEIRRFLFQNMRNIVFIVVEDKLDGIVWYQRLSQEKEILKVLSARTEIGHFPNQSV